MPLDLDPIERHFRDSEAVDLSAEIVIRGWPLTVDGLLRNADATRRRYSFAGQPFVAISVEVVTPGWTVDRILAGQRLRTRRSYASAQAGTLIDAGFSLLPTFAAPHYSVKLMTYTEAQAQLLINAFGTIEPNPHFTRRSP